MNRYRHSLFNYFFVSGIIYLLFLSGCNSSVDDATKRTDPPGIVADKPESPNPDTTEPSVDQVDPQPGALNIAIDKRIEILFSEPISSASIAIQGSIDVFSPGDVRVAGIWELLADSTARFTPLQPNTFTYDTEYRIVVTNLVKDRAGNDCVSFTSTFRTQSSPDTPATVINMMPANMALAVEPNENVSIKFSKSILASVINDSDIQITNSRGSSVLGSVAIDKADDTKLVFTADQNFDLLQTYRVSVPSTIAFADQSILLNKVQWQFSVRDGDWNSINPIGVNDSVDARNIQLFNPKNSNAILVWDDVPLDGATTSIHYRLFDNLSNIWGGSQLLTTTATPNSYALDFNDSGEGLIVWNVGSGFGGGGIINMQRYQSGSWLGENTVDQGASGSFSKSLGKHNSTIDETGNIFVVWDSVSTGGFLPSYNSSLNVKIFATTGTANTSNLNVCGDINNQIECSPTVVEALSNGSILASVSNNTTRLYTQGATADSISDWGSEETFSGEALIASGKNFFPSPLLASDAISNAMIVWLQNLDGHFLWANRRVNAPSSTWQNPLPLDIINSSGTSVSSPQLKMNQLGNAATVWIQVNSDSTETVISNIFSTSNGWLGASRINNTETIASNPSVAIDEMGNVVAVWQQTTGNGEAILANRYVLGTGWQTSQQISENTIGDAVKPQVVINPNGAAWVVWTEFNGASYNLVGVEYK